MQGDRVGWLCGSLAADVGIVLWIKTREVE